MKEFNCTHCGMCCGPVPVSRQELQTIRDHVGKMKLKQIMNLKNQKRDSMTCIFYDTQEKKCGIYEARPEICKMFGFYQGMVCPDNTSHATKSRGHGEKRLKQTRENMAGILTVTIGWNEILGWQ